MIYLNFFAIFHNFFQSWLLDDPLKFNNFLALLFFQPDITLFVLFSPTLYGFAKSVFSALTLSVTSALFSPTFAFSLLLIQILSWSFSFLQLLIFCQEIYTTGKHTFTKDWVLFLTFSLASESHTQLFISPIWPSVLMLISHGFLMHLFIYHRWLCKRKELSCLQKFTKVPAKL